MTVEDLREALDSIRLADAPDEWALAAYRLAVATSETANRPEDMDAPLELLDRAARILTRERAPLEHGRILTAAANCQRARGDPHRALELFALAEKLLTGRAQAIEQAGVLINLGLAHNEAGRPEQALGPLDRAVAMLTNAATVTPEARGAGPDPTITDPIAADGSSAGRDTTGTSASAPDGSTDDEARRLLGAALINRAQAHGMLGQDGDLDAAHRDYRSALTALPATSLQAAMAAHGLGATVLEQCRRGVPDRHPEQAVDMFEQSLSVLGHASFPFHHAVARHSLALAYEMRGRPGDPARAINSAHAALSVFDPRLHPAHWRTAHATMQRLEAALDDGEPDAGPLRHVARLLAAVSEPERERLLRDRLLRTASLPTLALRADLEVLIGSLAALAPDDYQQVLHTMIGVLMELPDQTLEAACATLCRVHQNHPDAEMLDEALDEVITQRLFGPQRVRTRDLLETHGWIRP